MSGSWSAISHILMPVNTRNAPNRYSSQPKLLTRAAPRPIMMARSTITPRMPQNSTRCWYWRGIAKKLKISAMTKTLSMDSDFDHEAGVVGHAAGRAHLPHTQAPKISAAVM